MASDSDFQPTSTEQPCDQRLLEEADLQRTRSVAPDFAPLASGTVVGAYKIKRTLGYGGCGAVYLGSHLATGREVAIKVLLPNLAQSEEMLERFRREAQLVTRIRHPNIVEIYEVAESSDRAHYFTMEFLSGINLTELLAREGRLSLAETVRLLEPVCLALQAAHDAGVVHRDMKASNVMLTGSGDTQTVKLLDFGIAKLMFTDPARPGLTTQGQRLGSPVGMPPEQIRGETVDGRVDVYALGVLTFELLTGRLPFAATTAEALLLCQLHQPPPRPSERVPLPLSVDAVVLRALHKQREERYPTVREFFEALRQTVPSESRLRSRTTEQALEVVLKVRRGAATAADGDLHDKLAELTETAEEELEDAAWVVELCTDTAVAARLTLPVGEASTPWKAEATRRCEQLFGRLRQLAGEIPGIELDMTVTGNLGGPPEPPLQLTVRVPEDR